MKETHLRADSRTSLTEGASLPLDSSSWFVSAFLRLPARAFFASDLRAALRLIYEESVKPCQLVFVPLGPRPQSRSCEDQADGSSLGGTAFPFFARISTLFLDQIPKRTNLDCKTGRRNAEQVVRELDLRCRLLRPSLAICLLV